jgi:hypothetical protein
LRLQDLEHLGGARIDAATDGLARGGEGSLTSIGGVPAATRAVAHSTAARVAYSRSLAQRARQSVSGSVVTGLPLERGTSPARSAPLYPVGRAQKSRSRRLLMTAPFFDAFAAIAYSHLRARVG